jgi:hypothetical protein
MEDQIDAAMDELLDAHMEGSDGSGSEEGDSDEEGESESEDSEGFAQEPSSMDEFFGIKKGTDDDARGVNKRKLENATSSSSSSKCAKVAASGDKSDRPHGEAEEDEAAKIPSSFSKVVTSLSDDLLKEKFPKYLEARGRELNVTLNEGEMLYLPCGWFHEVTSMNATEPAATGAHKSKGKGKSKAGDDNKSAPFHMAVNYWFHPPDGPSFDHPYADSFWPDNWRQRGLDAMGCKVKK